MKIPHSMVTKNNVQKVSSVHHSSVLTVIICNWLAQGTLPTTANYIKDGFLNIITYFTICRYVQVQMSS